MRYPAVAGRFYPADRDGLLSEIESCFNHPLGPGTIGDKVKGRSIRGALVPHAGYACSGMNAAHVFKRLAEESPPDAYVIIGPDHYGIPYPAATCSESYLTPLGECRIHEDIIGRLSKTITDSPAAHRYEHSIEVEVPFIQYIDPDARIVPIIMHDQSIEFSRRIGESVRAACDGYDVVVIASSDMSHYVPKSVAERNDMMVLNRACALDINGMYSDIWDYDISACGYGPIAAMITAVSPDKGVLLKHTDSWDSIHYQKNSVVGYGSAVFI